MDLESVHRVLATPLAAELLRSHPLCHLGYTGRDAYPRVVPVGFLWKDDAVVVCTAARAPKVRDLEANPRVALSIDTNRHPPHILLVRGTARTEIVDGVPDEYLEASHKYFPREQWRDFDVEVRGIYDQMARIRIAPEWAKLIDFENTLPSAVEELVAQRAR